MPAVPLTKYAVHLRPQDNIAVAARGIPVVMGGMHVTACPEEAKQHCDAVVTGEAEGVWPQVLADFMKTDAQRYGQLARELNIKAD